MSMLVFGSVDSDSELLSTSFQGKNIVGPCDIWRFPPQGRWESYHANPS